MSVTIDKDIVQLKKSGFTVIEENNIILIFKNISTKLHYNDENTDYRVIINDDYIVLLAKKIAQIDLSNYIYKVLLAQAYILDSRHRPFNRGTLYYLDNSHNVNVFARVSYNFHELGVVFDRQLITIAQMINKLISLKVISNINVKSSNVFSITWKLTDYIPMIFTMDNRFNGVFDTRYLSVVPSYFTTKFSTFKNCEFTQTIDFSASAKDSVIISRKCGKKTTKIEFKPSRNFYSGDIRTFENCETLPFGKTRVSKCPSGYMGEYYTLCDSNGLISNYSKCYKSCPASNGYPETKVNTFAIKQCNNGQSIALCQENSEFKEIINNCYTECTDKNYSLGKDNITVISSDCSGNNSKEEQAIDYKTVDYYKTSDFCNEIPQEVSVTPMKNNKYYSSVSDFPETPSGVTQKINGISAKCVNGSWENISEYSKENIKNNIKLGRCNDDFSGNILKIGDTVIDQCGIPECVNYSQYGEWNTSIPGEYQYSYDGSRLSTVNYCDAGKNVYDHVSKIDNSVGYKCPIETVNGITFPEIYVNNEILMNCNNGQEGYIKRKCKLGKVWGPIENTCKPKGVKCPADSGFPETDPGKMSLIDCNDGSNRYAKRYCTMDSKWSSIQNPCLSKNNDEKVSDYDYTKRLPKSKIALLEFIEKAINFLSKLFNLQNS